MKTINFRPLRRIKKTGKITVASYMQWRKVKTADCSEFNLLLDPEYQSFDKDEFVYDHKGEQLFFYPYNPSEITILNYTSVDLFFDLEEIQKKEMYGIYWGDGSYITFKAKGLDVDGVPTMSHFTADCIGTHYKDANEFEPLTVGMVVRWFGWFLYQLEKSKLQTKTT